MFDDEERREGLKRMLQARLNEHNKRWDELDDFYKDRDNAQQFYITGIEQKALHDWIQEHNKVCPYYDDGTSPVNPAGAIGGRTTYQFTPTGLGVIVTVECACGEKENVTDYDNW